MFREMRNRDQQLPRQACIDLLRANPRGVLSLLGDEGYPYGVPTNFWYCENDGCLYFHGGKQGHKVDAMNANPRVSLCVMDQGRRKDGDWAMTFQSVVVFGRIEILDAGEQAMDTVRKLSLQFTGDTGFIEREIQNYGARTLIFRLVPEHITGKWIREA